MSLVMCSYLPITNVHVLHVYSVPICTHVFIILEPCMATVESDILSMS